MGEKLFNIGDKVYSTKSGYDLRIGCCIGRHGYSHEQVMEKRIRQIETGKDGEYHYGVVGVSTSLIKMLETLSSQILILQ